MARILIMGVPRAGKTTLAQSIKKGPVLSTDDTIDMNDYSAQIDEVVSWLDRPGPWVIEGVLTVYALRRYLRSHRKIPCDTIYVLKEPKIELTPEQNRYSLYLKKAINGLLLLPLVKEKIKEPLEEF